MQEYCRYMASNTTLEDLSAEIGFSATVTLAAWFGDGTSNVYVPLKPDDGQQLVRLLGMAAAVRLSNAWGGEHLAIPSLSSYEEQCRRRFIGRLLAKGLSTREVARWIGISERRVQQICRELEAQGLIPIIVPKTAGRKAAPETTPENPGEKAARKSGGKPPAERGVSSRGDAGAQALTAAVRAIMRDPLPPPQKVGRSIAQRPVKRTRAAVGKR